MMLIKVRAAGNDREEIKRLSDIFRGRILDVTNSSYMIELTGTSDKLDAFIRAVGEKFILEVVRSGPLGIGREDRGLKI
uniref:Acetolactate synthase small subunit n=1 Tax=Candidatus Kentrum sp. SD TaxID=2126332 RepID=A0A451BLW2_9GAMM|nr:MAG: acetolactate synthase, small subunit [Candidatus Kentron sp. SD]